MRKRICIVMSIIVAILLSGCTVEYDDINDSAKDLYEKIYIYTPKDIYHVKYVEGDTAEIVESCFEDIEFLGAKFTLPMNTSDIPDEFELDFDEETSAYNNRINAYNGFMIASGSLEFEGSSCAEIYSLYPAGGDPLNGQLIRIIFIGDVIANIGCSLNTGMTLPEVQNILSGSETDLAFSLPDGRTIEISEYEPNTNCYIQLSLSPEFGFLIFPGKLEIY